MAKSTIGRGAAVQDLALMYRHNAGRGAQHSKWCDALAQQHLPEELGFDRPVWRLDSRPWTLVQRAGFAAHARRYWVLTEPTGELAFDEEEPSWDNRGALLESRPVWRSAFQSWNWRPASGRVPQITIGFRL
jgi:hypothetical protein